MKGTIELEVVLNISQEELYNAWLSSKEHSNFTKSKATIVPTVKGRYTTWEGYITGETLELHPHNKVVQSWRTTDFKSTEENSLLEVLFEPQGNKTKLILKHSNIPEGTDDEYKIGWKEFYIEPMKEYYNKQ